MKDTESKFQKYFVFLNLVPGVKKEDGTRTYDFKNGSINFKLRIEKLYELYTAITCYSRRQNAMIGPFSIINDSSKSGYGGSGLKTLYMNYKAPEEGAEGFRAIPSIVFNAKHGDKSVSVGAPMPSALAFAEVCKKVFDLAIERDMEEFTPPTYDSRGRDFESDSAPRQQQRQSGGSESFPSFSNDEVPF